MAQSGYTPIQLYYSTTTSAVPTAGNLADGELAINITDGKVYYKDNTGTVRLLASQGDLTTISFGTTGLTPSSATGGAVTVAGTLVAGNGGTGINSYNGGDILYATGATTLARLGIGTNGQIITSNGTVPQWTSGSSISVGTASNLAGGSAGSVPYQSGASTTTFLSIGTANQVLTSSGSAPQWSTNLTIGSLTASSDSSFTSTGALQISKGTTAQRAGTPATGMIRYNTTTNQFEGYSGSSPAWSAIGGGSALSNDTSTASNLYPLFANATTGTPTTIYTSNANLLYRPSDGQLTALEMYASNGVLTHANQVTSNYTVPTNANVITVGPWTVASGASFTLPSGSRQVLL
jgi:hypothetical protein